MLKLPFQLFLSWIFIYECSWKILNILSNISRVRFTPIYSQPLSWKKSLWIQLFSSQENSSVGWWWWWWWWWFLRQGLSAWQASNSQCSREWPSTCDLPASTSQSQCWDYWCAPPHLVYAVLWLQPRAFCMLGPLPTELHP